jgi:hypothetical protein
MFNGKKRMEEVACRRKQRNRGPQNQMFNLMLDNFQPQAEYESQFNPCCHKDQPVKPNMTALL